jgi:hypothetical protein
LAPLRSRPESSSAVSKPDEPARHAETPPTGPLVVSASLYRATPDGEERLLPGARVGLGDGLFMEIEVPEPLHVYVLNEDASGEVNVLFPVEGFETHNPLPAGVNRIPGTFAGQVARWKVTSAGGREHVIVVATRRPQADLERDIAGFPAASPDRPVAYGQLTARTIRGLLRGIGGVELGGPTMAPETSRRLSTVVAALPAGPSRSREVWTWQFELENPPR